MSRLPICPDEPTKPIYHGRIRSGRFGELSEQSFTVRQCLQSQIAFLDPFPSINYSAAGYRESVNGSSDVESYFRLHDAVQIENLAMISAHLKRGMVVADCGCGGGSLLDFLKPLTSRTVAVEPFVGYHDSLRGRGHEVFPSVESALAGGWEGRVDFATSFHVIEHTNDPVNYLRSIGSMLAQGGRAFVLTPNLDDVLMKVHFREFAPFFFRLVHNYYFNQRSLSWVADRAGFKVLKVFFFHEFGLSNFVHWLRDNRPMGNARVDGLDEVLDGTWKSWLQFSGQSNNLAILIEKLEGNTD